MNASGLALSFVEGIAAGGTLQMLVVQLLAFLILAGILWKFVRPVLLKILDQRSKSIDETFVKIKEDTAEAARQVAELRERLARIDAEARRITDRHREEARQAGEQMLSESGAQVQAAMDKAKREIQIERDKAILEIRQKAADLTLQAADRLVEASMNDDVHERLVEKTLTRLESVKKQ